MRASFDDLDEEGLEVTRLEKIKVKRKKPADRQTVGQLAGQRAQEADDDVRFEHADLNELARMDHLDELIRVIKSGKEASVYLGRNSKGLAAVKVYTDMRVRSFKHDEAYRSGRFIGDVRIRKAIEQGSRRGQEARQALWVQEEFRQMKHLAGHGVRVPEALAVNGLVIIMEFIGEEDGTPAPRISDIVLEKAEAREAFRQSVQNLKRIVASGRVHGDYSTFNILWHAGEAVVIDFPQVMEINSNPNAKAFLERDVRSLCGSFRKQGIAADEAQVLREIRAG